MLHQNLSLTFMEVTKEQPLTSSWQVLVDSFSSFTMLSKQCTIFTQSLTLLIITQRWKKTLRANQYRRQTTHESCWWNNSLCHSCLVSWRSSSVSTCSSWSHPSSNRSSMFYKSKGTKIQMHMTLQDWTIRTTTHSVTPLSKKSFSTRLIRVTRINTPWKQFWMSYAWFCATECQGISFLTSAINSSQRSSSFQYQRELRLSKES